MSEKYYQVGTHTPDQWYEIHNQLMSSGGTDTIPSRCVMCVDEKPHSPTRGTFLLTDEEAETLKTDPRVKWINIDFTSYPEQFKPNPSELQATSAELLTRWQSNVKVYRDFENTNSLPVTPDNTDINRTGYQLLRPMQKLDPWVAGSLDDSSVVTSNIQQFGDGRDVDVIVADDGAGWIGHPEFQNNCTGAKPTYYVGGNRLPGNGTCDILDIVLDAPYYLDPDYFNANSAERLTTRWDGTIVPVESVARSWWASTANRSGTFNNLYPSAGTVTVTSSYTRAYCNGSNTAQSSVGEHCTPCMALTYGRTQGWAYNANKWVLNHYGTNGADIEPGFDLQKIFHQTKPINPKYGTKNPTVSSNSWGYRSSKGTTNGYYHFRNDDPVQYPGTSSEPAFISHMGSQGDSGRWKSEFKPSSLTTALDELIDVGVIFVVAAGNSNQKQVNWGHPDFDNYISATSTQTLEETTYSDIGQAVYGTTNRRGFPQQGGKTVNPSTGEVTYKTINVGALDDDFTNGDERKVGYSDRGEGIDVYMPADGTLAANRSYTPEGIYPDTYPGFTANSGSGAGVPEDTGFSGTSAACPVAAGFIACLMGLNRAWTYQDVKNYFQSLDVQSSDDFYYGVESTTATSTNWTDYNGLEGGDARVGYQDISKIPQTTFPIRVSRVSNGLNLKNIAVTYVGRFDRG
jgi:hypothetical protein